MAAPGNARRRYLDIVYETSRTVELLGPARYAHVVGSRRTPDQICILWREDGR